MSILVGYNGTNVSKDAVKLAMEHADLYETEVDIVSVMSQSPTLTYDKINSAERSFEGEIQQLLEGAKARYKTQMVVTTMSAGEALVEFAERHQSREIVIGVQRRSKVGKLVFSSTAQHVILKAPCPVVSIK